MSTSKYFDRICAIIAVLMIAVTAVFMNAESLGATSVTRSYAYEDTLFDTDTVHTIDIVIDDWDGFLETATQEEYVNCTVIIDGKAYKNVAIRAKGNTSLTNVARYGNNRYSFKLEFDHYDDTNTYYGLDKLSLNNIIQDNTYMKDYLVYTLMRKNGVDAPLCSFVYITVNGEDWGLYLAVEAIEDSFLSRTYGSSTDGELYKPDSMSMGGGKGMGGNVASSESGWGSSDVKLIYTDDEYSSYSNIFENAKSDLTDSDKDRLIASLKTLNEGTDIESVVDVEEVIKYFVVHNFVCNFDSYTGSMIHNYYLYEEDGVLSMIPWDYNLAFGGFVGGSDATSLVNYPIDSPVSGGDTDSRPMIAWIFNNEEYLELYHQYFSEFIEEFFESGYVSELIDSTYEMIASYVESDPTKFCTYEEFTEGVAALKEFCELRAESVRGQLDGIIPSTSEGQSADKSAFINASDLSITAMGSMGNGGGPGGNGGQGGPDGNRGNGGNPPTPPDGFNGNGDDSNGDNNDSNGFPGGNPPDMPNGGGENQGEGENGNGFPGGGNFSGFGGQNASGNAGFNGQFPGNGESGTSTGSSSTGTWILLGASLAALLAGLLIAFFYKKKN
ncbi:MAG: CotH kinase family protein [Lachnospiraceae bacterium]|nr:CotH kinase family protein [Lachnospiraceae bacterium]